MSRLLSNTTLTRKDRLAQLKDREHGYFDLQFLRAMPADQRSMCFDLLDRSQSQLRQDIFALAQSGFRQSGFFLEFGATDGVDLSNTQLMETGFGWSGILAEPTRRWHNDLKANRACTIDTRCVWKTSGEELQFTESIRGEKSGISAFVTPTHKLRGRSYTVKTVSLNDLLVEHNAPNFIDFASIDTEGSEFDILSTLDFERWSFGALTVEHNYVPQRQDIHALLTSKGYKRVLEAVSRFDDWYIRAN